MPVQDASTRPVKVAMQNTAVKEKMPNAIMDPEKSRLKVAALIIDTKRSKVIHSWL